MFKMTKSFPVLLFLMLLCSMSLKAQKDARLEPDKLQDLITFSEMTYTDEIFVLNENGIAGHWKNNQCDSLYFNTASMVKSWTGLVIGIMIDHGLISSVDDLVCKYIPEWKDGCAHGVTIKHLLTMSAGLNQKRGAQGALDEVNINNYIITLALDTVPGIRFSYSNESVQLLGKIIEIITGKTANDYFKEVLFIPLGMDSTQLAKDQAGNDIVFGGAQTTLSDASKIGLLMLHKGKFGGQQIVSEQWVVASVTASNNASFYGYLWWLDNNSTHRNFAATGDFGQLTIVFPDLQLVFMRRQSCNKDISGNMPWMGPNYIKKIAELVVEP